MSTQTITKLSHSRRLYTHIHRERSICCDQNYFIGRNEIGSCAEDRTNKMTNDMLYIRLWVSFTSSIRPSAEPYPWKNAGQWVIASMYMFSKNVQTMATCALRPTRDSNLWFTGLLHFYCDKVNLSERYEYADNSTGADPVNYTKTRTQMEVKQSLNQVWNQHPILKSIKLYRMFTD